MSQYGATEVAAESLIAQINTHCNLATLRDGKIKIKIRYENEIQKANEHAPEGAAT
jgi:hypothetical protein